jgi:hypothetical protein
MPLINLQTNLKSLKYGHDRPDGGSSDQPYIQTDVNDPVSPSLNLLLRNPAAKTFLKGVSDVSGFLGIGNFNVDEALRSAGTAIDKFGKIDDGFIRGGIIGSTNAAITDTVRLIKFFTDAPKGPLFLARQAAMQLTNPRLEWKRVRLSSAISNPLGFVSQIGVDLLKGQAGNLLDTATRGYLGPTRLYNLGINTIAQIPISHIGGHILRHGLSPISADDKYEAIAIENNRQENNNVTILPSSVEPPSNRLLRLAYKFELGDGQGEAVGVSEILRKLRRDTRRENRRGRRDARRQTRATRRANREAAAVSAFEREFNFGLSGPGGLAAGALAFNNILRSPIELFGDRIKYKNLKLPDSTKTNIDDYLTGPGSVYGIGFTSIRRYSYTEDLNRINESLRHSRENAGNYLQLGRSDNRYPLVYIDATTNASLIGNALGSNKRLSKDSFTYEIGSHPDVDVFENNDIALAIDQTKKYDNYDDVAGDIDYISTLSSTNPLIGIYNTVRNTVDPYGVNNVSNARGYYNDSVDFGTGSIIYTNGTELVTIKASHWWKVSREANFGSSRQDDINLTPMFSATPGTATNWDSIQVNNLQYRIKDLVPFMIEAIDGENPSTKSVYMIFRAYLTDLSDSVDAEWTDIKYVGRGEKFYVYNGFNRKISISFKVAALSAQEMKPMYQKLNALMGNLMPDYVGTNSGVMRGPLVRMTVGNWINSQPGKLDSLSYKVTNDSPWEINIDGDKDKLILPHIVEVSLNFTPIGSQTGTLTRLSNKESKTNFVSHIAQNYNSGSRYIDYSDIDLPGTNVEGLNFFRPAGNSSSPLPPRLTIISPEPEEDIDPETLNELPPELQSNLF